jgi:hypothetical protein
VLEHIAVVAGMEGVAVREHSRIVTARTPPTATIESRVNIIKRYNMYLSENIYYNHILTRHPMKAPRLIRSIFFLPLILLALLAACGGSEVPSTPDPAPINVQGTAATGSPLASAKVSLLCANGGVATTVTTSDTGKWAMRLPSTCAAPYFVSVTGIDTAVASTASSAVITLYSFSDEAGIINIKPFTDLLASFATHGHMAADYAAVLAGTKSVSILWNPTTSTEARAKFNTLLVNLGVSTGGIVDVIHGPFEAKKGDPIDDALERLKIARGSVTLAALAESVNRSGGVPGDQPWKTLFPQGVDLLTLNAMSCQFTEYPDVFASTPLTSTVSSMPLTTSVSSAIVTIKRGTTTVSISVVPNSADTTLTFPMLTIGNATSSFDISIESGTSLSVDPIFDGYGHYVHFPKNYVNGQQSLDINQYVGSVRRSFTCSAVDKPFTYAKLNNFHPQARLSSYVSSFLAGSPTATIGSSPEGCSGYLPGLFANGVQLPGTIFTYTYGVNSVGEVKFDNKSLSSDWLKPTQVGTTTVNGNNGAGYRESTEYDAEGFNNAKMSIGDPQGRGFFLYYENKPSMFRAQLCGF